MTRVHIVQARPWKDALIRLLEPQSPYQPWNVARQLSPGEAVIAVLDTDPVSVLAGVGRVAPHSGLDDAMATVNRDGISGLLELGTLNMVADFVVNPNDDVVYHSRSLERVVSAIGGCTPSTDHALFGHTSLTAARALLHSAGICTGGERRIDLTGAEARDHVHIHTVADTPAPPPISRSSHSGVPKPAGKSGYSAASIEQHPRFPLALPKDWPAVLCDGCHERMRRDGFVSFLELRFSLHPPCPDCSAQQSRAAVYGMPTSLDGRPWIEQMGCCVEPWRWVCAACGHHWQ